MAAPPDWTPHRRDDGELLGWIHPAEGELWQAVDLLGRPVGGPGEWLDVEADLDARGLGWLAERWQFEGRPVRIAEVSTTAVVVVADEFGAASNVGAEPDRFTLPWPAPAELHP